MLFIKVLKKNTDEISLFGINYKDIYNNNDIGEYDQNKLCVMDILNLFNKDGEKILFSFTEFDKDLDEDKEEFSDIHLRDYHKGYQHDPNDDLTNGVKDILLNHYKLTNNICSNDIEFIKENLIKEFKENSLDDLDEDLKTNIKNFLYDKIFHTKVSDYSKEIQNFINERTKIITKDYEFPYDYRINAAEEPTYIRDLWVELSTKEDIRYWIENISDTFACIITDNYNINCYDYFLLYYYDHINDGECIVFNILENTNKNFINEIFPKLENYLNYEIKSIPITEM